MSRTTRIETMENPAVRLLKWKSSEGTFQYWDKDSKTNVNIDLPFRFAILEEKYVSFSGFSEDKNAGFWSNEVKDAKDLVVLKCGDEIVEKFKKEDWKNVKNNADLKGTNYSQIVYIAADFEGSWNIYRLMLQKSAFTGGILKDKKTNVVLPGQDSDGWINFLKNLRKEHGSQAIYDRFIEVNETKSKKNGAVTFMIPVYSSSEMSPELNEMFNEMAQKVDDWFQYYNTKNHEEVRNREAEVYDSPEVEDEVDAEI